MAKPGRTDPPKTDFCCVPDPKKAAFAQQLHNYTTRAYNFKLNEYPAG